MKFKKKSCGGGNVSFKTRLKVTVEMCGHNNYMLPPHDRKNA